MEILIKTTQKESEFMNLSELANGTYLCNVSDNATQTLIFKTWHGAVGLDAADYTSIRSWRDDSDDYRLTKLFNVVPVTVDSVTVTPK